MLKSVLLLLLFVLASLHCPVDNRFTDIHTYELKEASKIEFYFIGYLRYSTFATLLKI